MQSYEVNTRYAVSVLLAATLITHANVKRRNVPSSHTRVLYYIHIQIRAVCHAGNSVINL